MPTQAPPSLSGERRAQVLGVVGRTEQPMGVGAVAAALGVGRSTARLHLELLAAAGLVTRSARTSGGAGRPEIVYSRATHRPSAAAAQGDYETLARALAASVDMAPGAAALAVEAGRRWAAAAGPGIPSSGSRAVDGAEMIVRALDGLGFEPEYSAERGRVLLRRCPFESVARDHRAVVCGIHEGMILESLRRAGGGYRLRSFEPFAADHPPLCIVELAREPAAAPRPSLEGS